jgi:sec-independent protein translocase protein TatC
MTTDTGTGAAPVDYEPPVEEPREGEGAEMTLIEHLLELRKRVFFMSLATLGGMLVFFMPPIGFRLIEVLLHPARQTVPDFRPQAIEPMEILFTFFHVALLGGLTLAMPVIVYQALRFITPALTRAEKRWIFPLIFGGTFLFIAGLAFAYFVVLPLAMRFMLTFGSEIANPDWRLRSYVSFTVRILLVLGFVFQTPLIVMTLAKFNIVSARRMLGWWRYAVILAFIIAAIATPTIDPVTQTLVAGPIVILYFVGLGLAWLVRRE